MMMARARWWVALLLLLLCAVGARAADEASPLFLGIFSEACWPVFVEGLHQLFVALDPVGCVKRLDYYLPCALEVISKVVSYGIIAGSALLKVPQISAILRSRSAAGLSVLSLELDVAVFIASVSYSALQGYAFSTYGEQVFVLAQNVVLVALAYAFASPRLAAPRVAAAVAAAAVATAACARTPPGRLWVLSALSIAANVGSRVPQILANRAQGHTGQLAPTTVKLNTLGAFVRFLTTLFETADPVLLFGFGLSTALNAALLVQLAAYRAKTAEVTRPAAKAD